MIPTICYVAAAVVQTYVIYRGFKACKSSIGGFKKAADDHQAKSVFRH